MYRPQFAYAPPQQGIVEEEFEYYFDPTNTPALKLTLQPGQQYLNIPLTTQNDADFLWRGIQCSGPGNVGVRFHDPYGNYMSDGYVPLSCYSGFTETPHLPGADPVVLEQGGGQLLGYLLRGSTLYVDVMLLS